MFRTVLVAAALALPTLAFLPGAAAHNPDIHQPDYSACMWHPEIKLDRVIDETLSKAIDWALWIAREGPFWTLHCATDHIPNDESCIIV